MDGGVVRQHEDGVRVTVKVTPKAGRTAITGTQAAADGSRMLKVSVTEAAADGRANAALIRLLAKAWDVARSDIRIILGQAQRIKTLAVSGEATALRQRILCSGGITGSDAPGAQGTAAQGPVAQDPGGRATGRG